jgi:hypothetical protein
VKKPARIELRSRARNRSNSGEKMKPLSFNFEGCFEDCFADCFAGDSSDSPEMDVSPDVLLAVVRSAERQTRATRPFWSALRIRLAKVLSCFKVLCS